MEKLRSSDLLSGGKSTPKTRVDMFLQGSGLEYSIKMNYLEVIAELRGLIIVGLREAIGIF